MGQTLHTFTVLAHAPLIHTGSGRQRRHGHRGWGEKVVREWGGREGGGGDLTPIWCSICMLVSVNTASNGFGAAFAVTP